MESENEWIVSRDRLEPGKSGEQKKTLLFVRQWFRDAESRVLFGTVVVSDCARVAPVSVITVAFKKKKKKHVKSYQTENGRVFRVKNRSTVPRRPRVISVLFMRASGPNPKRSTYISSVCVSIRT